MGTERQARRRAAREREREHAAAPAGAGRRDVAMLRALQGSAGNAAVAARLARFTEVDLDVGFAKQSDDRSLAVPMESNLGSRRLWGRQSNVATTVGDANNVLRVQSPIRLNFDPRQRRRINWREPGAMGAGRKRRAPTNHWAIYYLIFPSHEVTRESGDRMTLLQDCGHNTAEVIGTRPSLRVHYTSRAGVRRTDALGYPLLAVADLLTDHMPGEARGIRVLVDAWRVDLRNSRNQIALDRHLADLVRRLRPAERSRLERDAVINAYAVPRIGQGVVIVGGGPRNPDAARKWQFHQAPVVIKSADGQDYVTLENFNTRVGGPRNTDWAFNMYGPHRGQSIHEQQTDVRDDRGRQTGEFGDMPTTFVVG